MAVVFPGSPDRHRSRIMRPQAGPRLAPLLSAGPLRRLGRRDFLRGSALLTSGAFLAACGGISSESAQNSGASEGASAGASDAPAQGGDVLNFSNWPLYMDTGEEDEQSHPTLDAFSEETGIKVSYFEDVNSNEEYFGKVRNQLANGQPIGRDLMVLTDWMAARMIGLDWLAELDQDNIPNMSNLRESLQEVAFDPERKFSLPWQSGMTGIGINPTAVDKEITSVNDLFDEALAGRVTMLSEMRDTMGLVMAGMGIDPLDHTFEEYQEAIAKLQKAVDSGQIRQFTGNEYATDLAAGNIAAAVAWSGDIIQLQFDNPDLQFLVPDEGGLLWSDNMLVPNTAEHQANAEALMDYYYQPEVAAELAAWVNYITPVEGAEDAMAEIDDSLVGNELIFPSEELLGNTFDFKPLDEQENTKYQEAFQSVIGA